MSLWDELAEELGLEKSYTKQLVYRLAYEDPSLSQFQTLML